MSILRILFIFCFFLFTACAPTKLPSEITAEKNQPLNKLPKPTKANAKISASEVSIWELSGAIAARNQNKGWSATINWAQQGPQQYQIRLIGPVGSGTIMIEKRGSTITYSEGSQKETSNNADHLLKSHTGVSLPVQNLYYWVRGLPAPGHVKSIAYNHEHQLTTLKQSGYTIHFSSYSTVNNVDLPSKIQLQGNGTTIKLVIQHWRI